MLPSLRWRDSNPRSRMAADLQSALVAAGEHLKIFVEPRGVEPRSRDFQSCAYTKSAKVPSEEAKGFEPLERFCRPLVFKTSAIDQLCQTSNLRKQKDSNLRSLAARHVSSVLVSTAHPYFHWISGAKVQCHSAAFLRNKKKLQKMIIFR